MRLVAAQPTTVSKPLFLILSTTYKTLETCQSTRKYVVDGNLAGDFTDENVGKCRLLDQWRNRRLPLLILRGAWRRQLRGGNPI